MTAPKKKPAEKSGDSLKQAVIAAALPHIAFDGFTDTLMDRAAKETGAGKDEVRRLFPNGALSLLEAYSADVDAEMEKQLANAKIVTLPVRKRIAMAVKTRLAILKPHKEAVRRGVAHLSLPPNIPLGAKLVYNTVDAMWRAAGDVSTDFNFYTKRGILAGVYSATLMRWLTDTGEDESATDAFLAARIENVMQFEKFKARAKSALARLGEMAAAKKKA